MLVPVGTGGELENDFRSMFIDRKRDSENKDQWISNAVEWSACVRTSPSARFLSNSFCFSFSSAMRTSIALSDSRVKGRNKLRSSSESDSNSVIVHATSTQCLSHTGLQEEGASLQGCARQSMRDD